MKTTLNLITAILLVTIFGSIVVEQIKPIKVPVPYFYPKNKKDRR